jgi:DNA-binding transcriptional MerR regulator
MGVTTKTMTATNKISIPDRLFFRIGDVAELLGVKPHVLRYWESEFSIIHPEKSTSGHRVYRRTDVESLLMIKHLLYEERYSIEGARNRLKELKKEAIAAGKASSATSKARPTGAQAGSTAEKTTSAAHNTSSAADFEKVRELAHELEVLIKTPVSDLFRY